MCKKVNLGRIKDIKEVVWDRKSVKCVYLGLRLIKDVPGSIGDYLWP